MGAEKKALSTLRTQPQKELWVRLPALRTDWKQIVQKPTRDFRELNTRVSGKLAPEGSRLGKQCQSQEDSLPGALLRGDQRHGQRAGQEL